MPKDPAARRVSLDPLPVEMTDANYEKLYNNQGETRLPLEDQYLLIEDLNTALVENAGHPSYNPASLTIHDFTWAHVRYGGTTQLCAHSNSTGKVLSSDVTLIPKPENLFQGYMAELTKLSS